MALQMLVVVKRLRSIAKLKTALSGSSILFLRKYSEVEPQPTPQYVQGQHSDNDIKSREYFYYIDHQGMLFLDDSKMKNFTSCFKEKKFLKFFFSQLMVNKTGRYAEFPYISPCGKERNFVRCDDLPVVFTHMLTINDVEYLSYAHAGDALKILFHPEKLCMQMENGRVYHPGPDKNCGVGLIRSKLSIQLSSNFVFRNGESNPPTDFVWKGNTYTLTQELVQVLENLKPIRCFSLGINDT